MYMHEEKKYKNLSYYAKILLAISITFILYGAFFSIYEHIYYALNPVSVDTSEPENTVSITTVDDSEVVVGDNTVVLENPGVNGDSSTGVPDVTTPSNNNGGSYTSKESAQSNVVTPSVSQEEINEKLRDEIQDTFGVSVLYGKETSGYKAGGLSTTIIDNPELIYNQLIYLKNTLNLYPDGMFQEIRNGGIPLTILLVYSYSEPSVTGITDSTYTYAYISIAAAHPFEESFYHESYHYIERYMFKSGASFSSWDSLNPDGFQYGTVYNDYSYSNTFAENSFFVNNYAQTAETEDRASTFEYMMASTKASCLNNGNPVWRKADYMSKMIRRVLNSVRKSSSVYWEQHLY